MSGRPKTDPSRPPEERGNRGGTGSSDPADRTPPKGKDKKRKKGYDQLPLGLDGDLSIRGTLPKGRRRSRPLEKEEDPFQGALVFIGLEEGDHEPGDHGEPWPGVPEDSLDDALQGATLSDPDDPPGPDVEPFLSERQLREWTNTPFDLRTEAGQTELREWIVRAQAGDRYFESAILYRLDKWCWLRARKLLAKTPLARDGVVQADLEDTYQNVRSALLRSIHEFNPEKGNFLAYAKRAALTYALRPLIKKEAGLSDGIAYDARDLKAVASEIEEWLGGSPMTHHLQVGFALKNDPEFRREAEEALGRASSEMSGSLDQDLFEMGIQLARRNAVRAAKRARGMPEDEKNSDMETFRREAAEWIGVGRLCQSLGVSIDDVGLEEAARLWAQSHGDKPGLRDRLVREVGGEIQEETLEFDLLVERARRKLSERKIAPSDRRVTEELLREAGHRYGDRSCVEQLKQWGVDAETYEFLLVSKLGQKVAKLGREAPRSELYAEALGESGLMSPQKVSTLMGTNFRNISLDKPMGGDDDGRSLGESISGQMDLEGMVARTEFEAAVMRSLYYAGKRQVTKGGVRDTLIHDLAHGHRDLGEGREARPFHPSEIALILGIHPQTVLNVLASTEPGAHGYTVLSGAVGSIGLPSSERYHDRRDVEVTTSPERARAVRSLVT